MAEYGAQKELLSSLSVSPFAQTEESFVSRFWIFEI
jgi:hypothetical protein